MFRFFKKLRGIAGCVLLITMIFISSARPVSADIITGTDWTALPLHILKNILGSSTAASTAKTVLVEVGKKFIARVGEQVLLNMTQQVINWSSTGFNGNPFFVRDQPTFFKSLADQQVELFVNEITADETQFPYARDIAKNLILNQVEGSATTFAEKSKFNLDQVIGSNWKDFGGGDFSVGGWDGWLAYTQNDANNPIGAYMQSQQELQDRITAVQSTVQNDLEQGNGFLSMKKCVEYKDGSAATDTDIGGYLESLSLSLGSNIQFDASDTCSRYETVTPSSLVATQIKQAVEAPLQEQIAKSATGFKTLDAIANLAGGLISGGITKLIGNITSTDQDPSYGGPGNNSAFIPDVNSGSISWNVPDNVNLESDAAPGTPSTEVADALNNTQIELNILIATRDLMKLFPDKTRILDQCLPGPDYKYATRMRSEFITESKKLESKSDNNTDNGDQAQDQLKYLNNVLTYVVENAKTNMIALNIPSAALIIDQVNKVQEYNQTLGGLDGQIADKVRTVAILKGIIAGIAAHPKPDSGEESPEIVQYKNQLAAQYVTLKSKISQIDTITDTENECTGVVTDYKYAFRIPGDNLNNLFRDCSHTTTVDVNGKTTIHWAHDDPSHFQLVTDFGEKSLQQICDAEKLGTDDITVAAVKQDQIKLLFCGTHTGNDPDPLAQPGWQWIDEFSQFNYSTGGFVYTKGYNDQDFKMECNKFYTSSIGDYLPGSY